MERNSENRDSNLLDYTPGPANIKILGCENIIIVSIRKNWLHMLEDLKETCVDAWKIKDEDIEILSENTFQIKFDLDIVKNYLDYVIIFL